MNTPLYLVTGGCGFIGSHLVEALLRDGCRVRVLDNLSTGHRENLADVADAVDLRIGDITNPTDVSAACAGVDGVFHLAALVSVADSVERPLENHRLNATGTLNVLLAARNAGARRVVFASSAAIYGNAPGLPKREDQPPAPVSPYGAAKLMGEHYLKIFHRLYGLEAVSCRFFNVYGPRQDPSSPYSGVISRFVDALRAGAQPVLFGDGEQTRDFVFVADVASALLGAMRRESSGDGSAYNVATGAATSLLQLLDGLGRVSGVAPAPRFEPARGGDVRHSLASIDAAQRAFGFTPAYSLAAGLAELWKGTTR
ncbi:MAG TPA: SDR family oxidoreductase [Kiritimatiellia bacterium]|nr:SDR family oxidoreductase [Kiritimatiellia bacterium]